MPERVLMTADAVGGIFTYALDIAAELGARGHDVELALMGPRPSVEQRRRAASVTGLTVHESDFALEWMDDPWADVAAAGQWLRDLVAECAPSVVHLNGFAHGALDLGPPTIVVAHSCLLSWYEAVLGRAPPPRFSGYHGHVRAGLEGATAVVAVSDAMRSALLRHYDLRRPVDVIHNGVPEPALVGDVNEPFVLACGRMWDRAKNIGALSRVAPFVPWLIRAAGWDVEESGLAPLGWLSQDVLGRWMERASIFASPALYEPFGLAALEAAQRTTALVLGDLPSQHEIWADAALFVSSESELEDALLLLIEDDILRTDLAFRAADRVREFTVARTVDALLAVYDAART